MNHFNLSCLFPELTSFLPGKEDLVLMCGHVIKNLQVFVFNDTSIKDLERRKCAQKRQCSARYMPNFLDYFLIVVTF